MFRVSTRATIPKFACLIVALLLAGCQPVANIKPSTNIDDSNTAHVFIYRPNSNWAGVAIDYRVTANGELIGSLGAGKALSANVQPGRVAVKVQGYFLGIAGSEKAEFETTLSANQEIFLRYSMHIGAVIPMGTMTAMEVSTVLQPVSETQYKEGR